MPQGKTKEQGRMQRIKNRAAVIMNSRKSILHPDVSARGKEITLLCLWKYQIPALNKVYMELIHEKQKQ